MDESVVYATIEVRRDWVVELAVCCFFTPWVFLGYFGRGEEEHERWLFGAVLISLFRRCATSESGREEREKCL